MAAASSCMYIFEHFAAFLVTSGTCVDICNFWSFLATASACLNILRLLHGVTHMCHIFPFVHIRSATSTAKCGGGVQGVAKYPKTKYASIGVEHVVRTWALDSRPRAEVLCVM